MQNDIVFLDAERYGPSKLKQASRPMYTLAVRRQEKELLLKLGNHIFY